MYKRQADTAVDGGSWGGGELAGEGTDVIGVDITRATHGLRGEVPHGGAELFDPIHMRGQRPQFHEVFVEEDVGHRGEQQGVAAGPDRDVAVGELGGAGAARVDDGEGAAAGLEGLELAGEVGGGAQTPVGLKGVGADEEQMVGVVEIRDRDRVGVAVEQTAGDVFGHLVDRGRGEDAAGAEGAEQDGRVEGAGHGVHVRVAEDDTDGVRAVPLDDRAQAGRDRVERLVPGGLAQLAVPADERGAQPVGVAVDGTERGALGADEPPAEHVVAITPGAGDPGALDGERQPTGGFAQGADTRGGAGHGASQGFVASWRRAYRAVCGVARGVGGEVVNPRGVDAGPRFSPTPAPDKPATAPASPR